MNIYSERRSRLMKSLEENRLVMVFSGKAPYRSEDETYDFTVNRNFYYLTGIDKEDMVLLMYAFNGNVREALFIQPFDETLAKWVGGRMLKSEAAEISGISDVEEIGELDGTVSWILNMARSHEDFRCYFDLWHYEMEVPATPALMYVKRLQERYPGLKIADLYPAMIGLRRIKDEHEISCIRKAIEITDKGIRKMMKVSAPGLNEMTMEGTFEFVLKQSLCRELAFKTIAASGKRATVLHYSDNDQVMEDGELFLCDLGATCEHYSADISRTFPVNGHFTDRQREIYEIVLKAQKIVEENARPGVTLRELNSMVLDFYREELPKHGLNEDVSEYYYHSCSHHLGLDTHDIDNGAPLQAGNVITDEPGLYIETEGIGIRIEDDLLIRDDDKAEVLSSCILKDPDEIETFMKGQ